MNSTYTRTNKPFPSVNKWVAIASFTLLLFSLIINGALFQSLWLWFIVPVFHLPELTLVSSIGVQVVVQYLSYTPAAESKDLTWTGLYKVFILSITKILMYLAIGGVLHLLSPIN